MNKKGPKNAKVSIHNKYKRRLRLLSSTVADFITHAEDKLAIKGINKRAEMEHIVSKCHELAKLLPDPDAALAGTPIAENFLENLFNSGFTERVLAEAKAFSDALTDEDWQEMHRVLHSKKKRPKC